MRDYSVYWERCWQEEEPAELFEYLGRYHDAKSKEVDVFKAHNVRKVCDAACGFGAYSLMLASNGFEVYSFDISDKAVEITKEGLRKYGLDTANVKVASILDTEYTNEFFDGVVAHAVLDHLTKDDTEKALEELFRITKAGGLIWLSFDIAEEADFAEEHVNLADGVMEYVAGSRKGMLFQPHDWEKIEELLSGYNVIYREEKGDRERVVILKKNEIKLVPMTAEMYHAYFKEYQNDLDLYIDKDAYVDYVYDEEKVNRYIRRQIDLNRKTFAIMRGNEMVGEVIIKNIEEHKCATMGIAMRSAKYKDKGYGTQAERLAIDYVFYELDIPTLYADSILSNTRSQHVLENVGFRLIGKDEKFRYYQIDRDAAKIFLRKEIKGDILDIGGGGEGIIGRLYKEQVTAIDNRQEELDEAPEGFQKVLMDATKLQYENATFDNVTFFYTLMFMSTEEQRMAICEVERVLKRGGEVHIWDCDIFNAYPAPFCIDLEIQLPDAKIATTYGVGKLDGQSCVSIRKMCEDAGLRIVNQEKHGRTFYLRFSK